MDKGFESVEQCLTCDNKFKKTYATPLSVSVLYCWPCFQKECCSRCKSKDTEDCKKCGYRYKYENELVNKG